MSPLVRDGLVILPDSRHMLLQPENSVRRWIRPVSTVLLSMKASTIFRQGNEIAIVITADVFLVGNSNPLLVYDVKKGDRSVRWNSLDVRKFVTNSGHWEKVFFMLKTGKNCSDDHSIVIYFWNPDKSTFYIDNFKVEGVLSEK